MHKKINEGIHFLIYLICNNSATYLLSHFCAILFINVFIFYMYVFIVLFMYLFM